jgi:hypothetical protein
MPSINLKSPDRILLYTQPKKDIDNIGHIEPADNQGTKLNGKIIINPVVFVKETKRKF